ncbi:MAG: hypothetical protein IPM25_05605 [Chloracidobacterium sp.]|nr:hypothetical protein [Chloracidobacterium sp.]
MRNKTARSARPKDLSTREIGTLPWSYLVVIAICGCIVAAGFLLAARQHFVSMDLGMKNSKLRKQLEDLEAEKRRLTLAKEIAFSPVELTRTARSLGFVESALETQVPPADLASAPSSSTAPAGPVIKTGPEPSVPRPVITRTAYQRPAHAPEKADATSARPSSKPPTAISKAVTEPTRERIVTKPAKK